MRGGRAGEPDPDSDQGVGKTDLPVGDAVVPEEEHHQEAEQAEEVAGEQREPGAARVHELGRAGRDQHQERSRRQDREPGLERRVAQHVLEELLADEHRAHERPEHDHPRRGGDPEDAAPGHVEVVERVLRTTLADHEGDERRERDGRQPEGQRSHVRHGREVDREDERRDEDRRTGSRRGCRPGRSPR